MAATCVVQPLDLVKNRMQLSGTYCLPFEWFHHSLATCEFALLIAVLYHFIHSPNAGVGGAAKEHKTSYHVIRAVIKNEGISGMYAGLSAGLLRQASYTTVRMGVYNTVLESYTKDGRSANFAAKAGIGRYFFNQFIPTF